MASEKRGMALEKALLQFQDSLRELKHNLRWLYIILIISVGVLAIFLILIPD